jgi:hypothetical protein
MIDSLLTTRQFNFISPASPPNWAKAMPLSHDRIIYQFPPRYTAMSTYSVAVIIRRHRYILGQPSPDRRCYPAVRGPNNIIPSSIAVDSNIVFHICIKVVSWLRDKG